MGTLLSRPIGSCLEVTSIAGMRHFKKTGLVNGQGEKGYAVRPTESNWSTGAVVQTVEEEFC
jgi:hypothetical protein